jgi:DNA-binding transcriptional ArsR family regulator
MFRHPGEGRDLTGASWLAGRDPGLRRDDDGEWTRSASHPIPVSEPSFVTANPSQIDNIICLLYPAPMDETLAMLDDAGTARVALSPLRRELLARLREPASAAGLAEALGVPRQKIGYHLRVLEKAGLIGAVSTRKRRGFTETLFEARSGAWLIDPMLLAPAGADAAGKQDRFAAAHLVRTAAGIVRDVSRMQEAAADEGSRLLTFTVEADVAFARPSDIECFAARVADALAAIAADFASPGEARRYRVTIAGHPAAATREPPAIN